MKNKIIIGCMSVLTLILLIIGSIWMMQSKKMITIDTYQSSVKTLITDVRSNAEKWNDLLGGVGNDGLTFVDLCGPVYAEQIRTLGQEFIAKADAFDSLNNKVETLQDNKEQTVYFNTYRQIGTHMVTFSDVAQQGDYDKAMTELDEIIKQYDTLPALY